MANNIYGVILAGGKGTRMGNVRDQNSLWKLAGSRLSCIPLRNLQFIQNLIKLLPFTKGLDLSYQ